MKKVRKLPIGKHPLYIVFWLDAVSDCGWQDTKLAEEENKPAPIVTVGFLLHKSKHSLLMAMSVDHEGENHNATFIIPMGMVVKMVKIS